MSQDPCRTEVSSCQGWHTGLDRLSPQVNKVHEVTANRVSIVLALGRFLFWGHHLFFLLVGKDLHKLRPVTICQKCKHLPYLYLPFNFVPAFVFYSFSHFASHFYIIESIDSSLCRFFYRFMLRKQPSKVGYTSTYVLI